MQTQQAGPQGRPDIQHLDELPESALVTVKTFAALIDAGVSTIWRRAKLEPDFPQPIRLGDRCTRWRMGDIRGWLTEQAEAVAGVQ